MADNRGSCWSITINNPKEDEYSIVLPSKWKLQGQLERGNEGTLHYQGMLTTPQVRFAAVKKVFPRAHIEVAKSVAALQKYVHKEDTRVAEVQSIPTLFEYQTIIAEKWDVEQFAKWLAQFPSISPGDVALRYCDSLVATDVAEGRRGGEFIAINPMWRSSWKTFYTAIIQRRDASQNQKQHEASGPSDAQEGAPPQGGGGCESPADITTEGRSAE